MMFHFTTEYRVGKTNEILLVLSQRPLTDATISAIEKALALSPGWDVPATHTAEADKTVYRGNMETKTPDENNKSERLRVFRNGLAAGLAIGFAFTFLIVAVTALVRDNLK